MTIYHPIEIKTVSAPCGSGKTYAACRYIEKRSNQFNWLYVAPSIKLLEETRQQLQSLGLTVDQITSETHNGRVTDAIVQYLKSAESSGHVLLITWASYQKLPYFNRRERWRVIIDEVPQVDQFFSINLQQHIDDLLKYVDLGDKINETVALVVPTDAGELKRLLGRPDDLTKVLEPFYQAVLSPHKDVFVDLETWTRMVERRKFSKQPDANRIYFISMLNPELFRNATLMGANLGDSMLYHWFKQYHGALMSENTAVASQLRFSKHPPMGDRLKVQYLLTDQGYSKYLAKTNLRGTNHRYIDGLDKAALRTIGDRDFLYAVNADYQGMLDDAPNGTKIPVISHGLNCYQNETVIYFNVSMNRSPQHLRLLSNLGIGQDVVKNSTIHEAAYQAVMRTALRNPQSQEAVECIVPELETAARLASLFGEASIKWIGEKEFQKKKAMTGTERNKKQRAKQRKKLLLPLSDDKLPINSKDKRHSKMALEDFMTTPQPMYAVTFHATKYDMDEDCFEVDCYTPQDFVREMRSYSKDLIESKADNILINPTIFHSPEGTGGYRKQANFYQSSMMMLDFDNGDLSIKDFTDMFWTKAGQGNKRSFIIFNSFSRSAAQPNRFRVCLLYKAPAMSLEAHQAVYDSVVNRLEANGYTAESAKLDKQCRTGNQSFYMPATNASEPDWYYFEAPGCSTREINRYGIDPKTYLQTALPKGAKKPELRLVSGERVNKGMRSIDRWKSDIQSMTSGRHQLLFEFGLALKRDFKLSRAEAEAHLQDVAGGSLRLQKKVKGVMGSLDKNGPWVGDRLIA